MLLRKIYFCINVYPIDFFSDIYNLEDGKISKKYQGAC